MLSPFEYIFMSNIKRGDILNNTYEKNTAEHSLTLVSRKSLKLNGVKQILSFDDLSVVFSTVCGEMEVVGESLSVDMLDLDNGVAAISGTISGMNYITERPKKKRWFRGYE